MRRLYQIFLITTIINFGCRNPRISAIYSDQDLKSSLVLIFDVDEADHLPMNGSEIIYLTAKDTSVQTYITSDNRDIFDNNINLVTANPEEVFSYTLADSLNSRLRYLHEGTFHLKDSSKFSYWSIFLDTRSTYPISESKYRNDLETHNDRVEKEISEAKYFLTRMEK